MSPSLPGARSGLDVLGPVTLHSAEGHRYLAVVVDAWSGYEWTHPMCDVDGESSVQMLHAHHAFLARCGAGNDRITDLVYLDASSARAVLASFGQTFA